MSREQLVTRAFVRLADTLVDDYDVSEFLHDLANRCVELLGVDAAGVMLSDSRNRLRVIASSSEQARMLELLESELDDGPCPECHRVGRPVSAGDIAAEPDRWPTFAPAALALGFRSAHALPLRLRDEVIGVLNLFGRETGELTGGDKALAQALADVATVGILQERAIRHRQVLAEQLQQALNSRIVIEQAKGVIAERLGVDVGLAFDLLRREARDHGRRLSQLAHDVVVGEVSITNP